MSIVGTVYGDDKVALRLKSMGQQVREGLLKAMQAQWYALQSYIVRSKLSGQVLHRVTGVLASSINVGDPQSASQFKDDGNDMVGVVGTKVWYGAVHEYGGTFKTKAGGSVTFPERSFLRSGLADRSKQIREAIRVSVQTAMARA